MAKRQPREQPDDEDTDRNGSGDGGAVDEQELASYLEERIKPGLNRGAIPLVARSIAREIARDYYRSDDSDEDEYEDEYEDDDEEAADLEADLHELQQRLGEDWTLYYAVHGGDAWLAAEHQDAAQRVEAATADVLVKAVAVLNKGGSRSGRRSQPEDDSD